MSQQINLYQPMFRAERKVFSTATLLQAAAVVLAALTAIYGYAYWNTERMSVELERLRAQVEAERSRLESLSREQSARPVAALESRVRELTAQRNAKLNLLDRLGSRALGNTEGFSGYLIALARQHTGDLWLTRLAIGEGGERLALEGGAVEPASVPRYLQRLAGEAALAGRQFQRLNIRRDKDRGVQFSVATRPDDREGEQ